MYPYAVEKACTESETAIPELRSVGTRSTGQVLHAPHLTPHMSVFKDPQLVPTNEQEVLASSEQATLWKKPGMVHCA